MELFKEWISSANNIYGIQLYPIGTYQNYALKEKPSSLVRVLTNEKTSLYEPLEPPNLISDFVSNVITFCIRCNIKCTVFVIYTDLLPTDSLNTGPLVDILKQINFPTIKLNNIKPILSQGNLYV